MGFLFYCFLEKKSKKTHHFVVMLPLHNGRCTNHFAHPNVSVGTIDFVSGENRKTYYKNPTSNLNIDLIYSSVNNENLLINRKQIKKNIEVKDSL